ncbi:MAG: lipocalin family protein [Bacteroidales bacterium]|nr:lipocalin family protein [Bacteroidales bacterium]
MKTLKTLILIAIAGSFLIVSSCKKDDDDPVNKKATLTANSWKLSAMTVDPAFPFIGSNIYLWLEDCSKDDLMTFNENGTYTNDEGATKCDDADPQIVEQGSWAFNTDETQLIMTDSDTTYTNTIVSLSSSKLKMTQTQEEEGTVYTITVEMVPAN